MKIKKILKFLILKWLFISLVILQFIPISVLRGFYYPKFYLNVNIYNQFDLLKRIKDFVDKRSDPTRHIEKGAYNVCKTLFQKKYCELFYMPTRPQEYNPLPSGELCCCPFFENKGLVLCFIPSTDGRKNNSQKTRKLILNDPTYPSIIDTEAMSVSCENISFLIHQEGSIEHHANDIYSFQGIEVALLRPGDLRPTLFCGKVYSPVSIPYQLSIGQEGNLCDMNENYIFIECLSKINGLSCQIKFPILTEQEVRNKIIFSSQNGLKPFKKKIISSETFTICFPYGMSLDLPFGGIKGGCLYFFYKKTEGRGGSFRFLIMSNLAKFSKVKNERLPQKFPDWLMKKYNFKIMTTCTHLPYFFSSDEIKLVQKENSKEFVLEGTKMKLVCSCEDGVWGLFLSNLDLIGEKTFTLSKEESVVPKKPNLTGEKTFILSKEESAVPKKPKRKLVKSSQLQLSEKRDCKKMKSSTQIALLSPGPLDNPNQRPLGRLTASMVRFPVGAVPLQSAPLQLSDLPFDSNSCDLGVKTEASQATITSLSATSYGIFLQQNFSSITPTESNLTTSQDILSVPKEYTQSNEETWEDILYAIEKN